MIARIIVSIALFVLAAGFLWFMGQVIYLGVKEFFRIHGRSEYSEHEYSEQFNKTNKKSIKEK